MSISVSELDPGSWVIFELPGFTSATAGTPRKDSLDALRKASSTSYYRGEGSLVGQADLDRRRRRRWPWRRGRGDSRGRESSEEAAEPEYVGPRRLSYG